MFSYICVQATLTSWNSSFSWLRFTAPQQHRGTGNGFTTNSKRKERSEKLSEPLRIMPRRLKELLKPPRQTGSSCPLSVRRTTRRLTHLLNAPAAFGTPFGGPAPSFKHA